MIHRHREVLAASDVESIHQASVRLLANVGVDFHLEEALAVFRRHGFGVAGRRVTFTEDQIAAALRTVPAQFTIRARNPERSATIGGGVPVFAPGYGAPFLIDPETGRRTPTMDDYRHLVRLAHMLPNQDLSGHLLVEPGDVPAHSAHLQMLHAHLIHSDKPFIGSTDGCAGARHTIEMAGIVFGEQPRQPVTIGLINSLSPLAYGSKMLEALLEYARGQQPVIIAAMALAGSTAPITLAGLLAQQNAELLAGITLAQLVSPGTPVVYGSTSTNLHMKTAALTIGSPELSLLVGAHAQMARYYGLPCRGGGSLTDSNVPDVQAGFESLSGLLAAVDSGIDFVLHAAGILSSYLAFSYEKFVLDDELCGLVRHLRRGIEVSPETLAYDVIARVGPGGNFLTEAHTVKRCRREFWQPAVCDRSGLDAWLSGGQDRSPAMSSARQRRQRLLDEHQDPPLDTLTIRQLQAYVDEHTT